METLQLAFDRSQTASVLVGIEVQGGHAISGLVLAQADVHLCAAHAFFRLGRAIAGGTVEDGHLRFGLQHGRRVSIDAHGKAVGVGRAAAGEHFGHEGIINDGDLRAGVLLVEPGQNHVGILLQRDIQRLAQRERTDFSGRRDSQ